MRLISLNDRVLQALRDYWYVDGERTTQARRLVNGDIDLEKTKMQ